MNMNRLLGGASAIVHFAGIGQGRARAEEPKDDEPKGKGSKAGEGDDDDEDQPKGKSGKAEDPKDDEPKGKGSKAGEGDDDDEDQPKGKKSRRAADDDDDDENCEDDDDEDEMHGRSAVANARRRERARCAAIFGSTHAAGNVDLAASLAFNTAMTRKQAVKVLKSTPPRTEAAGDQRSADRRERNPNLGPSGESRAGKPPAKALWDRAMTSAGVPQKQAG